MVKDVVLVLLVVGVEIVGEEDEEEDVVVGIFEMLSLVMVVEKVWLSGIFWIL